MGLRCSISSQSAPTAGERRALQDRRAELAAALGGTDESTVTRYVSLLLNAYPSKATTDTEKRGILKLYFSALAAYPEWALAETCRRFNTGAAGNGDFAPTPAQMAKEAADVVKGAQAERVMISQVLDAEVYHLPDEAERARVAEGFERLVADCAAHSTVAKPRTDAPRSLNPEAVQQQFREAVEASPLVAANRQARAEEGHDD